MGATVVVGGQFGSEGKGKVTATLSRSSMHPLWCGVGGRTPATRRQSGGERRSCDSFLPPPGRKMHASCCRQVARSVKTSCSKEIRRCRISRERVIVDPRAILIAPEDSDAEQGLCESIGSTASGTGSALARRLLRSQTVRLAEGSKALRAAAPRGGCRGAFTRTYQCRGPGYCRGNARVRPFAVARRLLPIRNLPRHHRLRLRVRSWAFAASDRRGCNGHSDISDQGCRQQWAYAGRD